LRKVQDFIGHGVCLLGIRLKKSRRLAGLSVITFATA
jgi:hypothetical protein